jgi:hypothetical protein
MPTWKPKPKKPGRPRIPKDQAKGKIVPVRFAAEGIRKIESAAKTSNEKVSEWIRRSLEEAQVVKVMVRITDAAENKFDWFIGPPQECPPLPRIGERVECGIGEGTVQKVDHVMEQIDTKRGTPGNSPWNTYYKIIILIR